MEFVDDLSEINGEIDSIKYQISVGNVEGSINSNISYEDLKTFATKNLIKSRQVVFLKNLFQESRVNNFTIILEIGEISK